MLAEAWMASIGSTDLEMLPEGWTLAQKGDDKFFSIIAEQAGKMAKA